jgi:AraC-like DNA-binding protein
MIDPSSTHATSLSGTALEQRSTGAPHISARLLGKSPFIQLCRGRDLLADIQSVNVSIEDAACEARLSSFQFIRYFKAVFGETPHQFRTRERLSTAQRLLASGWSVTDVCLEIGFSSLGSFSSLFTREIGVSPNVYKRSVRRFVHMADWTPHPPNCLLLMCGAGSTAIFEKISRPI